jgi:hypothetical protein
MKHIASLAAITFLAMGGEVAIAGDLSHDEALAAWSGSSYTYSVGKASGTAYVRSDGNVIATSGFSKDLGHGTWTIKDDGNLCITWKDQPRWGGGCAFLTPLGGNKYQNGGVSLELFPAVDKFSLKDL